MSEDSGKNRYYFVTSWRTFSRLICLPLLTVPFAIRRLGCWAYETDEFAVAWSATEYYVFGLRVARVMNTEPVVVDTPNASEPTPPMGRLAELAAAYMHAGEWTTTTHEHEKSRNPGCDFEQKERDAEAPETP